MRPTALEILLRGHLWVESELIAILEEALPFPEKIDLARLGFPLKVALAAAHGLIRSDDISAYLKLNSMRNKVAHNLHDDPTEESVNELRNSLGKHLKSLYGNDRHVDKALVDSAGNVSLARLRATIACMCISLSGDREKLAEHHQQLDEANVKYQHLIQRLIADRDRVKSAEVGQDDTESYS